MKHIIIGGVAGGATAAARIRRADEFAQIILLEKGKYISYANCGLPYYIGGSISDRNQLFLQSPASFAKRFNIEVRVENEVLDIHPKNKTLQIRRADGSIYSETYDKLLLSPGATPARPPIPGINAEGIFTLRNVEDTDQIKKYLDTKKIKKAVVVGGGFIGLEMAENLHHSGTQVSIVEMGEQVMAPVDYAMASQIQIHLIQKGIDLQIGKSVQKFEKQGDIIQVSLSSGEVLETHIVILSIGVKPETALAQKCGLCIGETGGIYVNEYLESSEKDIYAVGDAIEFPHPISGIPWMNFLANPANRQGRIVADNMVSGNKYVYEGAIGTAIAKVFDMTVASTGLSAKKLRSLKMDFRHSITHSASHASYYPNAMPLSIQLCFDPKNAKVLGAQCVGYEGVDKRIDQIALLIKKGGSIYDLIQTEHTYAPPYSSAKDPISIAAYVAANILNGSMPICHWDEIQNRPQDSLLLDVRTPSEFSLGSIDGSVNIPLDELRARLGELDKKQAIIVFCAIGLRGYLALKILVAHGFEKVVNLSGGYKTYLSATSRFTKK